MKKNTLQSLTAAATRAAADSRSVAVSKLQTPASASSPAPGLHRAEAVKVAVAGADRRRMNLYMTDQDYAVLKELRKIIVIAGEKASDNSLVLTALRAVDLKDEERIIEIYKGVQADDGRRK